MDKFDAIVIGTGQSGPALAVKLAGAGRTVAIVERNRFGGTCVNTGCIPTKTLVASAYAAQLARRGAEYGVLIDGPVGVDMKRVKARMDKVAGEAAASVEKWLRKTPNLSVIEGHARFSSPTEVRVNGSTEVRVNGSTLQAPEIFINVGGRAMVPPIPGLDEVGYLTNSTIMDVDFVPGHLVIIGGSYIGLEFAQMYRRFGSQVTVIEKFAQVIGREDAEVSLAVRGILEREGVRFETGIDTMSVAKKGPGVTVRIARPAGPVEVAGSHLLVAVGRVPNTDDLGLAEAGVRTDSKGYVTVDEELRTGVPGIWAIGDCNGRGAFTHTSYNDYEIVAANLLEGEKRKVGDRITAYGLFIDPPLARVGLTEAEIRKSGRKALVGTRPMSRVGRAVEKGETQGFMRIAVDAQTKQILGAVLLGVGADEAIHCILDVMYAKAPYTVLQRAVHIHPTVSELIPTLLGELAPLE
jgi:pyruvate/2-oxoglutarate dehydrogenase complex dihydrolipoamide dehydrogenase (E3) component